MIILWSFDFYVENNAEPLKDCNKDMISRFKF